MRDYDWMHPEMTPVRTGTPAAIMDLATAKAHLRVEHQDEDTLIAGILAAATERLDGWSGILGRCLMPQTWTSFVPYFDDFRLRLPLVPVQSVTSVKYYDVNGVQQTFGASNYRLLADGRSAYIQLAFPAVWPTSLALLRDDAVSITFLAGYADAASVPAALKQAILLMVGDFYENRLTVEVGVRVTAIEIPMSVTVEALIAPYRAY